ncbi:unnamed protein product, partial [Prorocentrum cordatum]
AHGGAEAQGEGAAEEVPADPHVPRKLLDKHRLTAGGAHDFRPYGLRTLTDRLYVCDSDDDVALQERGKCGLVGARWQLAGTALQNKKDGLWTLPVRRWDPQRQTWTAEEAPYVSVEEWRIPLAYDGKVDMDSFSAMPRRMTRHSPGEVGEPIEASAAPLAWLLALAAPATAEGCRRGGPGAPSADFLCGPPARPPPAGG